MDDKLKIVEFIVKDDEDKDIGEMQGVAVVSSPAMEATVMFFNKTDEPQLQAFSSDERMEITGLAMRPNKKILRYNEKKDEHFYCLFSEKTVRQCAQLFFKHNANKKVNIEHISSVKLPQAFVFESWVVEDATNDKALALGIKDIKKGDWFITLKIDNPEVWRGLKERYQNGVSGFSVEGMFIETPTKTEESDDYNKLMSIVEAKTLTDEMKVKQLENFVKNWTKQE